MQATPFFPGSVSGRVCRDPSRAGPHAILVISHEDLDALETRPVAGLVVVGAAPFSHRMVRLLGRGVPTVLASHSQAQRLEEGSPLGMDGASGELGELWTQDLAHDEPLVPAPGASVCTRDGTPVALQASVADAAGAARAVTCGASAIGLVRSELLLPDAEREPDMYRYLSAFSDLCQAGRPLPVTVRLLDLAADKRPAWLASGAIPGLSGPLGLCGGRLFALDPVRRVIEAQITALARLDAGPGLKVIVPVLDRVDDFRVWRRRIERAFDKTPAVGAMIETPAAAMDLGAWLAAADFVAVGCNDLMQCLFGADRDMPQVGAAADPYAPALYRFLGQAALGAGEGLGRVQLCGLLAQMPLTIRLLVGLGFRSFSVEPRLVPHLARVVGRLEMAEAEVLSLRAQAARDSFEVRGLLGLPRSSIWTPVPGEAVP